MSLDRALQAAYLRATDKPFSPPPEAPVFEPTREEFADPLAYIKKIRAVAEPCGICRIRPPARWQPPFALDVDSLRFVPRVQHLAELEGVSRLRFHFIERLERYWRLSGQPSRSPVVEGRRLDLFALYHAVRLQGGHAVCNKRKLWPAVLSYIGYQHSYPAVSAIRSHYERLLLPFHELLSSAPDRLDSKSANLKTEEETKPVPAERPAMRKLRKTKTGSDISAAVKPAKPNRELQRLTSYGPGPKMPAVRELTVVEEKTKKRKLEIDPLAVHPCSSCGKENRQDELLVCEGCSVVTHAFCNRPPIARVPAVAWHCESCILESVSKPMEAFGFAQAEKEYSLQEFGEMADKFKSEYFRRPGHLVSTAMAEKEFWRIVSSAEENVTVEYGADLHSMDHGSGFPTKSSVNLFPGDQEYVDSGWNLNNLPVLDGSVLRFINDDISGMTVPWMYVGMCFSSFCWHNEDHWSYSINFLHWGEPKTWYGVPGKSAELLEDTMKAIAPELFRSQPDLLHQLVTIINPNILSEAGVPIYRTDQCAGEFVVTFPRSYHTGFNQGYNFAEAVNFAPPEWLSIGRDCILHYKNLKRFCVFSHDELICKMGLVGDDLDLSTVIPTYKELCSMVQLEGKQRGALIKRGVRKAVRRQFELLADDERLCEICKTTCFLSALICTNCSNQVCLDHAEDICECGTDNLTLNYRYNLDELHLMVHTLKAKIQQCDIWLNNVKFMLDSNVSIKNRENNLKKLIDEAATLKIPKCYRLVKLQKEYRRFTIPPATVIIELDD